MGDRTGRRPWTPEEDATVRDLYPAQSAHAIAATLGRTENAVWIRAVRVLGLEKRDVPAPWTEGELDELRRCYPVEPPVEIAKRLGRTASAVYQQAKVLGLDSRKMLIGKAVAHHYFRGIETAEQAYFLGLLASDGNVSDIDVITFGLHRRDEHLVRFMRDKLSPLSTLSESSTREFVSFRFTSHPMAVDLARWGVVPRKSRILCWPHDLGALQRPFLLGYFDGDGSAFKANKGRPGWTVCSGSEHFLVDMKAYIHEATGIVLEKIHHRPGTDLYQVATTGRNAWVLDGWLHQDGLGLGRKRPPVSVAARYA